jgi:DNA repair protein RecN (Recombination protein N)
VLKFLTINNIVLIEKANIEFAKNLCILSGETGSGKSILLDALGLIIGYRSTSRLIGQNGENAIVFAEFCIADNENCKNILQEYQLLNIDNPDLLNIRRIISASSGKVFVNDVSIGVNLLAKIGEALVEIHGQHSQQILLSNSNHLKILDAYANLEVDLKCLRKIYKDLHQLDLEISEVQSNQDKKLREKEYLQHVISEIENANIKEGEEDYLLLQKEKLLAKNKIENFISDVNQNLQDASSSLISAQRLINRNQNNNFLADKINLLEKISDDIENKINLIDLNIKSLEDISEDFSFSNDQNYIEERLFLIRNLSRKFNTNSNNLNNILFEYNIKLQQMQNENLDEMLKNRQKVWNDYIDLAEKISKIRAEKAISLSKKVENELDYLKMGGVKFLVNIERSQFCQDGIDKVKFLSAINGENFDEITKIASGGELSRFMLALKVSLMNVKSAPTIIFDEIDSGISGSVAEAVGRRLKMLSSNLQVLVVTHHPQIAAKADYHLKISKIKQNNQIQTIVQVLDCIESTAEVARMLSADTVTDEAILVAKNLKQTS